MLKIKQSKLRQINVSNKFEYPLKPMLQYDHLIWIREKNCQDWFERIAKQRDSFINVAL